MAHLDLFEREVRMYLARKKKERIKQEQLSTEVESKYTSPVYKVVKF